MQVEPAPIRQEPQMAPPSPDRSPPPEQKRTIPPEAKPPEMISVSPAPPAQPPAAATAAEAPSVAERKVSDWKMSDLVSDWDQVSKSEKPDEPKL
jgi:hypothetical protein